MPIALRLWQISAADTIKITIKVELYVGPRYSQAISIALLSANPHVSCILSIKKDFLQNPINQVPFIHKISRSISFYLSRKLTNETKANSYKATTNPASTHSVK